MTVPCVATLLDNARTAVVTAQMAGVRIDRIYVSPADYREVATIKSAERRTGAPLAILGIPIEASADVNPGAVRF